MEICTINDSEFNVHLSHFFYPEQSPFVFLFANVPLNIDYVLVLSAC